MLPNSQWLIATIKYSIYRGTAVAHIATKYWIAVDMATAGEIDQSYLPTAEMLTECYP